MAAAGECNVTDTATTASKGLEMTNNSADGADKDAPASVEAPATTQDPRLWKQNGWTAQVIKNDSDDGWAVAMYVDGKDEPALVGPWTMGRDKKNPKPLDQSAFNTLVKTATEVLQRHAQQRRAMLHRECSVQDETGRWITVMLDIAEDEDDPHAILSATTDDATVKVRVEANYKLSAKAAEKWVRGGFASP